VFGRESLREFIRGENEILRDLVRNLHEETERNQDRREEESRKEFRRRDQEFREFNREILLRNEKVYTSMIAQIEEGREQIRANTQAVLSALDRLEGSGGAAA
jgi:hypothetical protein